MKLRVVRPGHGGCAVVHRAGGGQAGTAKNTRHATLARAVHGIEATHTHTTHIPHTYHSPTLSTPNPPPPFAPTPPAWHFHPAARPPTPPPICERPCSPAESHPARRASRTLGPSSRRTLADAIPTSPRLVLRVRGLCLKAALGGRCGRSLSPSLSIHSHHPRDSTPFDSLSCRTLTPALDGGNQQTACFAHAKHHRLVRHGRSALPAGHIA